MSRDAYWQPETVRLFSGTFPSYRHTPREVVGRVHVEAEPYELSDNGASIHGVPAVARRGQRVYVHIWPCIEMCSMRLTAAVHPVDGQIGQVIGVAWGEPRLEKAGNMQGYYYALVGTFTIFEAYLERHLRALHIDEDANMLALWHSLETWIRTAFPGCQQITTPWRDPLFPADCYIRFLETLGYQALPGLASYGKAL